MVPLWTGPAKCEYKGESTLQSDLGAFATPDYPDVLPMPLRQHYWTPRGGSAPFVDSDRFVFTFNKHQNAGTWTDLHVHTYCGELIYVCTGSIVVCTDRGNYLGQGSRAVWVPPGLEHEWYMPEPCWNRTLFVHVSAFDSDARFARCHTLDVSPLLRELIFAMSDLCPDFSTVEGRRLGLVFVDRLKASRGSDKSLVMPRERGLVELCAQALASPEAPVCLEDWSRRLGMSTKTLARLFVRQTGLTFGRWLQGMRLEKAMADMEKGMAVTTAALNCGYTSLSAFIKAFKHQYGVTPGSISKGRSSREDQG